MAKTIARRDEFKVAGWDEDVSGSSLEEAEKNKRPSDQCVPHMNQFHLKQLEPNGKKYLFFSYLNEKQ